MVVVLKVIEGWADSRVDSKDWNCKWCWSQYNLREGCLKTHNSPRKGVVILPSDESTSMVGMEYLWKITKVSDAVTKK